MASARPLRDVFADLVGAPIDDPDALLRDQGHPGLPDDLIAEAVVSYADTAPVEVAEHLAPYVTTHSAVGADPVPGDEPPAGWVDLLSTAPAGDPAEIDDLPAAPEGFDDGVDLGFGTGADPAPTIDDIDDVEDHDVDGPMDILADPAGLDDGGEAVEWAPAEPAADPAVDPAADEFDDDDGEPDGEPLG
jgi:hypothetical protein